MKKAYFIVPIVGVLLFAAYYIFVYSAQHEARAKVEKETADRVKQEKLEKERKDREKALADAIALTEKRKKEREERDAKEKAEKDAEQALSDSRDQADSEQRKARDRVDRLNDELGIEKEALAKIDAQKQLLTADEEGLRKNTKEAESNVALYQEVIQKVEAKEKADAAAAKAAAEAAAKKSS